MTGSFFERLISGKSSKFQCHYEEPYAIHKLSNNFATLLHALNPGLAREIVIVGIGTDRSTGDCLGPLVGTKLCERKINRLTVYGTLDEPVHAGNLTQKLSRIQAGHPNCLIVAVDASLGKTTSIGNITISPGALKPGTGVKKELPHVGEMHFTGVINVAGHMEYFVLQNTRLSLVMQMADKITQSITYGYRRALSQIPLEDRSSAASLNENDSSIAEKGNPQF